MNKKTGKLVILLSFILFLTPIVLADTTLDELIENNVLSYSDGAVHLDTSAYHDMDPVKVVQTADGRWRLHYEGDSKRDVILVLNAEAEEDSALDKALIALGFKDEQTVEEKEQEAFEEAVEVVEDVIGEEEETKELGIIDGIALTADTEIIEGLEELNVVKAVYPDEIVFVDVTASLDVINATAVWGMQDAGTNITGENITVAIIDSGIDYTHPDFGNCTTEEFTAGNCSKIIGGYDYVNDDDDPMDDNGHGTHCGGIVAANGTIKGVAPGAKLYAYKSMNSGGAGSVSDIIAAMENATNLGADIISMSLGGSGDESSALSLAANNAFERGVLVVASSGNSGPSAYTVLAPGTSNKTLTVGATDSKDAIQSFSSRGPTGNYNIKPDVVAPGYQISSTVPTGTCQHCDSDGYNELSGTSMACPMVSGIAALIKQKHPDWTVDDIRSAIVNTATHINESVHIQGAGRVDAARAINTDAVIFPTSVSFGVDESVNADFNRTQIFTIKNLGVSTVNYNISTNMSSLDGVYITFNQTEFTIPAGENMSFKFNLYVNNSDLADGEYEGYIEANGTNKLRIPVYFVKSSISMIYFTEAGANTTGTVHIHDRSSKKYAYVDASSPLKVPVDPGNYDIVIKFGSQFLDAGDKWVIREGIDLNGSIVNIAAEEATNLVNYSFRDADNNSISDPLTTASFREFRYVPNINLMLHQAMTFAGSTIVSLDSLPMYFSNFSDNYSYVWKHPFNSGDAFFNYQGHVRNLTSDYTFDLGPNNTKMIRYYYPDLIDRYELTHYWECSTWTVDVANPTEKQEYRDMYYTPYTDTTNHCRDNAISIVDFGKSDKWITTPELYAFNQTHIRQRINDLTLRTTDDLVYKVSESNHFWYNEFFNDVDEILFYTYIGEGDRFFTQNWDTVYGSSHMYYLYDQDGNFNQSGGLSDTVQLTVAEGKWTVIAQSNFTVNTIENTAQVNSTFNTSLADMDPPLFLSLNMYTDGLYSDFVYTQKTNKFEFEVDPSAGSLTSVDMWYYDTAWHTMALDNVSDVYNTTVPGGINTTKVRFRILAVDDSGNSIDYEFDLLTDLGADLKPTALTLSENVPQEGNQITLNATVQNIGIQAAADVNVSFYDDGTLVGSDLISSMPLSGTAYATVTYMISSSGLRNLTVIVDESDDIIELNETNNIFSQDYYYLGAGEQLLTEFNDSSSSMQLNLTADESEQYFIRLPVFSKVNYALMDIDGTKVVYSEDTIDQSAVGDGSRNVEETNFEAQSFIPNDTRIDRVEINITARDSPTVITEPPWLRLRADDVVNDVGIDFSEATVPRDTFNDSFIENIGGDRGYRWVSFNFSDYDPMTHNSTYYLVLGTYDPFAGPSWLYRTTASDVYPNGQWYNAQTGTPIGTRDFQFIMYTQNVSYISNMSFYVDEVNHYNYTNWLYSTNTIDDFSGLINVSALNDSDSDGHVELPLNFSTVTAGLLDVSNLKVYYDMADLVVEDINLSNSSAFRGENVTATAVIKNDGAVDVTDISLGWKINGSLVNTDVVDIAAGAQTAVNYTFNTTSYNSSNIFAVVDNIFYVPETNESNNNRSAVLTITDFNSAPVMDTISNITVNETDWVNITVVASDPQNDILTYFINDTRFAQDGNNFTWQSNDNGVTVFSVNVTVSDGEFNVSQLVQVTVQDRCTPVWAEVNTTCNISDFKIGRFNDTNACFALTGLASDNNLPANNTYSCDYCTYNAANTTWSAWQDQTACRANDTKIENRSRFTYDTNYSTCYAVTGSGSDLWNGGVNITYWEDNETSCDFCTPNMVNTTWSSWQDQTSCLTNNTIQQNRTKVQYDSNFCGEIGNTTYLEFQEVACDYCSYNAVNATLIPWQDQTSCLINDTILQNSTLVEFDSNYTSCYAVTGLASDLWNGGANNTYLKYQEIACNYCSYDRQNTFWTPWTDITACMTDDTINQERNRTEYDANYSSCYLVTGLASDLWNSGNNITHIETQAIACDYCTYSAVKTSWTSWYDITVCQPSDAITQERNRTEYDENYATCYAVTGLAPDLWNGGINNSEFETQDIFCDFCTPNVINGSWNPWGYKTDCLANNTRLQERNVTQYDSNFCGEVANITIYQHLEVPCMTWGSGGGGVVVEPDTCDYLPVCSTTMQTVGACGYQTRSTVCDGGCGAWSSTNYYAWGIQPSGYTDGCDSGTYKDYYCSGIDENMRYKKVVTDSDGDGYDTECDSDCDDSDNTVYPGASEICDGKDNDCDTVVDEGCPSTKPEDDSAEKPDPAEDPVDEDTGPEEPDLPEQPEEPKQLSKAVEEAIIGLNGWGVIDNDVYESETIGEVEIKIDDTAIEEVEAIAEEAVITLEVEENKLAEFEFNGVVNLTDVVFEQSDEGDIGYVFVSGLELEEGETKILYVNNLDSTMEYVCIRDADVESVEEIAEDCVEIMCDGAEDSGYTCTYDEKLDQYKVEGLKHSGIIQSSGPQETVAILEDDEEECDDPVVPGDEELPLIEAPENKLEIADADIEVEGDDENLDEGEKVEVKPGDDIELTVEIKNGFEYDLDNVKVSVDTESEVDFDDYEREDIDAGDTEKFRFDFDIPVDIEAGTYDLDIEVKASKDGFEFADSLGARLKVERDKHDVSVKSVELNPEDIGCGRSSEIDIVVVNEGTSDEEGLSLKVINDALKIDLAKEISLDDNYDKSRTSYMLYPDTDASGDYTIRVELYDADEKLDSEDVTLSIDGCIEVKQTAQLVNAVQKKENFLVVRESPDKQKAATEETSFFGGDNFGLLVAVVIVLILVNILLLAGLRPRRRF